MSRFVAVSFLFMGWGFYELSGGADFQPPERSAAETAEAEPAPQAPRVTAASLVARPVMRPADLAADKPVATPLLQPLQSASTAPGRPQADPGLRTEAALGQIASIGASLAPGGDLFTDPAPADGVQVASLEAGLASLAVNTDASQEGASPDVLASLVAAEQSGPDMREVTANAVNMRGGPGTGYPVIGRMTRGQEVEILSDIGTGWLRLRDTEKNKVGWIAASLISRKAP
jgi:hypothetical protein